MPLLTPQEIQVFKEITKKIKGIELTDEEAEGQGSRLIRSFEVMLQNNQDQKHK